MIKILPLFLILFISNILTAQENQPPEILNCCYERYPEYPGGDEALKKFIKKNVIYPDSAINNDIQGKVIVGFTIDTNGCIINPRIKRGIGYCCDEEALRVIELMPRWKPGMLCNKKCKVDYIIPVKFTLN